MPKLFDLRFLRHVSPLILAIVLAAKPAHAAMPPGLGFPEIAQTADLIAIGTADSCWSRWNEQHTMIFTDFLLRDVETIHARETSRQAGLSHITIRRAGGVVGEDGVRISGQPPIRVGCRYLLCLADDGETYADPVVGGALGLFEVVRADGVGAARVYGAGGEALVRAEGSSLEFSRVNPRSVSPEIGASRSPDGPGVQSMPPPEAQGAGDYASPPQARDLIESKAPMLLSMFIDYIRQVALRWPVDKPVLRRSGRGSLIEQDADGRLIERDLTGAGAGSHEARPLVPEGIGLDAGPPFHGPVATPLADEAACGGGALGACGYHSLPLVMEQVPSSWSWFGPQDYAMWTWNRFIDLYRYTASDGTYGNNSQNEFGGWVADADLVRIYGCHWDAALAMTASWWGCACCRLTQSDILYNPAYSWTTSRDVARSNSAVILFMPTVMHELGHTWGDQVGDDEGHGFVETYHYDLPTVMQGYNNSVEEDGYGVHAVDAYLIRRQYRSVAQYLAVSDVGIESYHACLGLQSATPNASTYRWDDAITLRNVTVENMSYSAAANVVVRFYLSTDRSLSGSDIQIGNGWGWSTFGAESYSTADYSTRVPAGVPGGTYYVLAQVSVNGSTTDDFSANNQTVLSSTITILNPQPVISGLSPRWAEPGRSVTLTVTGSNFVSGRTVASFTPALSVAGSAVRSTTSMTVTVNLPAGATLGTFSLTLANPSPGGGSTSRASAFTVAIPVYPGDANGSGEVDATDILPLGLFYGASGAARSGASTTWGLQFLMTHWSSDEAAKADCNGDGRVDEGDVGAIVSNWGATHASPAAPAEARERAVREILAQLEQLPSNAVNERLRAAVLGAGAPGDRPGAAWLAPNSPNPFRDRTTIRFRLPGLVDQVKLEVFDAMGHRVWQRQLEPKAVELAIDWDGRDLAGRPVPSGFYFYRVSAANFTAARRLLRLR